MVNKIWQPGDTPMVDELAEQLRQETITMAKKIALEKGCSVDDLAFSAGNNGVMQVHVMTPEEKIELSAQEVINKRVMKVKKARGVFDV